MTLSATLLIEVAVEGVSRDGVLVRLMAAVKSLRHAADVLGLALKVVIALVTAVEEASLLLPVRHVDGGQRGRLVVLRLVVVRLVDGHGGVDDMGLNGLLVDYGLDGLMEMARQPYVSKCS